MLDIQKKLEERVANFLQRKVGKFGNYQEIPPAVLYKAPNLKKIEYEQNQIELDSARYTWLKNTYRETDFSALEIGANLGYFSLSLSADFGVSVEVYEPITDYSEVCKCLSRIAGVEHLVRVCNKSVGYRDIKSLNDVDLIINLNVLHHAGVAFDIDLVKSASEWEAYVKQYLKCVSRKSRYLFFQTGNMWQNQVLFSGKNATQFLAELLKSGNWEVLSIGVVEDPKHLVYSTYSSSELDSIPRIYCLRNQKTGLVDYFLDGNVIASLKTGLAQRSLWFCRSNEL